MRVGPRCVVAHTLAALARVSRLTATLVVLAPDDDRFEAEVPDFTGEAAWTARVGGDTRAATVTAGLRELQARGAQPHDWVLVHDAARCLIDPAWVDRLIDAVSDDEVGGLLALPVADTLKREAGDQAPGRAQATVDRRGLWAAQTPQMFRLGLLLPALLQAGEAVTDEASAIEMLGHQPRLVKGDIRNLKVTWPEDFALCEQWLDGRLTPLKTQATVSTAAPVWPELRVGEGWDTHALVAGRALVLGGVTIAHTAGLLGHSDADALLHAVTDALVGAAGLGDIGTHFPDTAVAFKGADSWRLLQEAARRVRAEGWDIINIDSTIVAQAPKMAPHIGAMRERIASAVGIAVQQTNVKAKTAEKMGPVGRGESIETRAVCLMVRAPR